MRFIWEYLLLCLSQFLNSQPPVQDRIQYLCVEMFQLSLMPIFLFFWEKWWEEGVWGSRVAVKAGTVYSGQWPFMTVHPFGPFRLYQQFYPSWCSFLFVSKWQPFEKYCPLWGADIKVHTHYIKGVIARTKIRWPRVLIALQKMQIENILEN